MADFSSHRFYCNFFKKRSFLLGAVFLSCLIVVLFYFFASKKSFSDPLQNCSQVASGSNAGSANPGVNCWYLGLPSCSSVNIPKHRENCADIIDLPLCSELPDASRVSNVNCVNECDVVNGGVHNQNCIRFCSSSVTPNITSNCANKKCHHFSSNEAIASNPGYLNCEALPCNLLTLEELDNPKFDDASKKYCDGSKVKCYSFTKEQIPHIKIRAANPSCQVHNCKGSVCLSEDDSLNITMQNSAGQPIANCASSNEYQCLYQGVLNGGDKTKDVTIDVNDRSNRQNASYCKFVPCATVLSESRLECGGADKSVLNPNCVAGGVCEYGYCRAENIDCNLDRYKNLDICQNSSEINPPSNNQGQIDQDHQSWFYRPTPPSDTIDVSGKMKLANYTPGSLCYTTDQLKNSGFGTDTIIFGWWYPIWSNDHKSMPICNVSRAGDRGKGYSYLCGPATIFDSPNPSETGFINGDVVSSYKHKDIEYKINACLRYQNFWNLETCGSRGCKLSCAFGGLCDQWCGYDVCRDLIIKQSYPDQCSYKENEELFSNSANDLNANPSENMKKKKFSRYDCVTENIDNDVRMRAVKYGRRICVFLDYKGGSNGDMFFNGVSLADGTCVDGVKNNGSCQGFNHNRNDGLIDLDKWRAVMTFQYIGSGGYTREDKKTFTESQCTMVPMKIGPPRFYKFGNRFNSANLFGPPLYISHFNLKRGGESTVTKPDGSFGATDFFFPELEVKFGNTTQKLSLGPSYIDGSSLKSRNDSDRTISKTEWESEECNSYSGQNKSSCLASPPIVENLETEYNGFHYYVDLFVKKDYNPVVKKPIFCLYRKVFDEDGKVKPSLQIGCGERSLPDLIKYNVNGKAALNFVVNPDVSNKYNKAKIKFKLFNNPYANSKEITLEDPNLNSFNPLVSCSRIEEHEFCAKRDDCSRLYYECSNNKIALNNAINSGSSTADLEKTEEYCNGTLRQNCNRLFGITVSSAPDIYTQNDSNSPPNPNAYGWRNEICINQGFEAKLRKVVAYKVAGLIGKCVIDTTKSNSANCSNGGKAPDCVCLEYQDMTIAANQEVRTETPSEAGLCIEIAKPNTCSAIDYTTSVNASDPTDPNFIKNSLNKDSYNDTGGVHYSHKTRTDNNNYGHAEFKSAIEDMVSVRGECNAFWKIGVGVPKMSCSANGWSSLENRCVRYQCLAINNATIDQNGNYPADYSNRNLENSDSNKGAANGFATWPSLSKNNDFSEIATATKCITGFSAEGSTAAINSAGKIIGYSGGNLPKRKCSQLGTWQAPISGQGLCQRIYCPSQNVPANPQTAADFAKWNEWGGARFNASTGTADNPNMVPTPASRSSSFATAGSTITGSCNNNAGYYQAPGAVVPTRECDSLGNWLPVQNPCVTRCDTISDQAQAATVGNGFATWPDATNIPIGTSRKFEGTCISGYIKNPYPKATIDDSSLPNTLGLTQDIASKPFRTCGPVTVNGVTANVWGPVTNPCVNYCPGSDDDNREGVGITTNKTKQDGNVQINWSRTSRGDTNEKNNCNLSNLNCVANASAFAPERTNGSYLMRRVCNPNGVWSTPTPACGARNDNADYIGNAKYGFNNLDKKTNVESGEIATGTCRDGFAVPLLNSQPQPIPTRVCKYKDSNYEIDKVALYLTGGSDCKEACNITNGQFFGNNVYTGSTQTNIPQGTRFNLSKPDNMCGSTSKVATCDSNGQFVISGTDDIHVCQACSQNSIFNDFGIETRWVENGCVVEKRSIRAIFDHVFKGTREPDSESNDFPDGCNKTTFKNHGESIIIGLYYQDYCPSNVSNKGICLRARLRCDDGLWLFDSDESGINGCTTVIGYESTVSCWGH